LWDAISLQRLFVFINPNMQMSPRALAGKFIMFPIIRQMATWQLTQWDADPIWSLGHWYVQSLRNSYKDITRTLTTTKRIDLCNYCVYCLWNWFDYTAMRHRYYSTQFLHLNILMAYNRCLWWGYDWISSCYVSHFIFLLLDAVILPSSIRQNNYITGTYR
jgi:hypothetical protein